MLNLTLKELRLIAENKNIHRDPNRSKKQL